MSTHSQIRLLITIFCIIFLVNASNTCKEDEDCLDQKCCVNGECLERTSDKCGVIASASGIESKVKKIAKGVIVIIVLAIILTCGIPIGVAICCFCCPRNTAPTVITTQAAAPAAVTVVAHTTQSQHYHGQVAQHSYPAQPYPPNAQQSYPAKPYPTNPQTPQYEFPQKATTAAPPPYDDYPR